MCVYRGNPPKPTPKSAKARLGNVISKPTEAFSHLVCHANQPQSQLRYVWEMLCPVLSWLLVAIALEGVRVAGLDLYSRMRLRHSTRGCATLTVVMLGYDIVILRYCIHFSDDFSCSALVSLPYEESVDVVFLYGKIL